MKRLTNCCSDEITLLFLDYAIKSFEELEIEFVEAEWLEQQNPNSYTPSLLGLIIQDKITNQTSKVWISSKDINDWYFSDGNTEASIKMGKIIADISFDLDTLNITETIPPEEHEFYIEQLMDSNIFLSEEQDSLKVSLSNFLDTDYSWDAFGY